MTAPPAPAKAAQSIITPLVGPLAATLTTQRWEKTRPPKPGSVSGKDIGEAAHGFFLGLYYLKLEKLRIEMFIWSPSRSAGHLGSSNSGSMPNLAAKNGTGGCSGAGGMGGGQHGIYLHSQSQPSSQYRIKEYPLYVEGSPNPVVVRSLESDQEGHYSVKAQFKTSSSYTAGGLYKEAWGGDEAGEGSGRLTPSRSQIVRTPSLGREGGGSGGRAAVSEELRCWYQRSSGSLKDRNHSHSGSTSSETGSQQGTLGHGRGSRVGTLAKGSPGGYFFTLNLAS